MTRNFFSTCLLLTGGALLASLVLAQSKPFSFSSRDLKVTNIDPAHFKVDLSTGAFSFLGRPRLHAELPKKHVSLDAARVDGTADPATKEVKTAKLTGGVSGTLDATSSDGPEHITFSGASVNYTNVGGADEQKADIEVFGGVSFSSSNSALHRTMTLTGSHGVFKLRPIDKIGLLSADLDGPVTLHYTGVQVGTDKSKKPPVKTRTPVSGEATGGHLTITRPESSTNYVVRMSGGVHLTELTGPNAGTEITTTAINIEFDAAGTLVRFFGDDDKSIATIPVGKARS